MKKQLSVEKLANELRGGSAFFPSYQPATPLAPESAEPALPEETSQPSSQLVDQSVHQSVSEGASQPSAQPSSPLTQHSVDQSTRQSIDQSTRQSTRRVDRPKAFYISEGVDRQIDQAVRFLQEKHGIRKADRSIVVNILLENPANWTDEAVDRMVSRVISQLTSRLTDH